ncbi:MAG: hypothetical protein KF722_04630 [Nitrospira sp.]|nr:hypothetical protein [Nitrospira sp.]
MFRRGLSSVQGFIFVFTLVAPGITLPSSAQTASCDAILGQWMWFVGGEVTVNRDGTFTQQSGNAGTWECNDPARGRFTFRWRDGGFTNSLLLSPDGQGLTSTDTSQWYVTARRTGSAPSPQPPLVRKQDPAPSPQPPLVREENCCLEAYACEVKKIEAAFEQKSAQCRGQAGNALCFKAAVSAKASGLQTASEKLRLCNRADNPGVMPPGRTTGNQAPSGGLSPRDLPPPPSSSDEFHSTEQGGDPCQCIAWPDQVAGDVFASDSPGADQGSRPPNGDVFGSDSPEANQGQPSPSGDVFGSDCPADYSNRDIPGASDEGRYALGFSQAIRQCMAEQVTIENLAIAAFAAKSKRIANLLRIAATPGAIDAVLRPPGSSPESNPYRRGKAEATRLCEWGLKVSPVLVARCPPKRTPVIAPPPQAPPRQPLAQLLSDLSWLRKMNPTGNQYNCGNTVLAVWQALKGRPALPAPPMSCAGTTTSQLESIVGGEFGPASGPPEIHNKIFLAGEGAHGIVYAKGPPPPGETRNLGHYFNIVRSAGEVYLLDGQLGRTVSWAEYLRMGFNEFRLLPTN